MELFRVLQWLTGDKNSGSDLVHVKGVRSVGKTRFMKEVAYYLYQRNLFEYKIAYQDLE